MSKKICIAVDGNAKGSDVVNVGFFKCNASGKKTAASELAVAFSPFVKNSTLRMISTASQIKVKDLRADDDLVPTGNCTACNTVHFIDKVQAEDLVKTNGNLNCTLCSTEYTPIFAHDFIASLDSDEDEGNDDEDQELSVTADESDENSDESEEDNSEENSEESNSEQSEANSGENKEESHADNTPVVDDSHNAFDNQHEKGNDLENNGEIVTASTKEFTIDCLASAGDLSEKSLNLVPVSTKMALILADDLPVIRLFADKAGDNASLFNNSEKLAKAVQAIVEAKTNDFSALGGEAISYTVNVEAQISKKIDESVATATEALAEEKASMVKEIFAASAIAANIVSKNIEKDTVNPIRNSMVDELTKRSITPTAAMQIADTVMSASANDYNEAVYNKTLELMNKPLGIRNEMAKFVATSSYVNTPIAAKDEREEVTANFRERLSNGSVAISTMATRHLNTEASEKPASGVDNYRALFKIR